MTTKPSKFRCACAGINVKSCRMPMKMPSPMPASPRVALMRKSDLTMISLREIISENESGQHSVAREVARHALPVATIGIAEFLLEVEFLAPDDREAQDHASRNDQDQHPVQRKYQCDPAQRDRHADIERITGAPKYAVGDQRGRRPQRIDVGAMPHQRAMTGRHDRHPCGNDRRGNHDPPVEIDILYVAKRHQPLQYAGDRTHRIRSQWREYNELDANHSSIR